MISHKFTNLTGRNTERIFDPGFGTRGCCIIHKGAKIMSANRRWKKRPGSIYYEVYVYGH